MTAGSVWETVAEAEALGIRLRLVGDRVRAILPARKQGQLADLLERLRQSREQVAEALRRRAAIPSMPSGVRLLDWNPKKPPVAIESCAVVVDVARFVQNTLGQLERALANPRRWVGWTVPQLVDRLRQVGVGVEVEGIPDA